MKDDHLIIACNRMLFPAADFPVGVDIDPAPLRKCDPDNPTFIRHSHPWCELVVVCSGRGIQFIDGESYEVSAGDIFMIREDDVHCFGEVDDLVVYNLMFYPERLPLPLNFLRKLPGYNMLFDLEVRAGYPDSFKKRLFLNPGIFARVEALLETVNAEVHERADGFEAVVFASIVELFALLARHYRRDAEADHRLLPRLGEVIARLESSYAEVWTLDRMAAVSCTSPGNFGRVFRRVVGVSPVDYLLKLRLRHAARMLRDSDTPIGEIAFAVGFSDSNYFSKQFSRFYLITPRRYRQSRM